MSLCEQADRPRSVRVATTARYHAGCNEWEEGWKEGRKEGRKAIVEQRDDRAEKEDGGGNTLSTVAVPMPTDEGGVGGIVARSSG